MIDYQFKYRRNKRSLKRRVNLVLSNLLFGLYKNKLFKRLRLNKNEMIRYTVEEHGGKRRLPFKKEIPKNPEIEPYAITLFDIVEFDELISMKKKLVRVLSRFKGGTFAKDAVHEVDRALKQLKDSYKTISYGNIYYNNLKDNGNVELIDAISYGYVKGLQSHMIMTYIIYPSKKFKDYFKQAINEDIRDESEIIFNSLKKIFQGRRAIASVHHKPIYPGKLVYQFIDEINYQFKKEIISEFNCGLFNSDSKMLFPSIVTYDYDVEKTKDYFDEIINRLRIIDWNLYSKDSIFFHFPDNFSKSLELFIPRPSSPEKQKDPFSSVSYINENYVSALSPFWTLLNISEYYKPPFIELRRKVFKYLKENSDSIFLKCTLKLRSELNLKWWQLERISKDFSSLIYNNHLSYSGIPKLENKPRIPGAKPNEFKEDIIQVTKNTTEELLDTFEELNSTFKRISEDNIARANMRLQSVLLGIAILAILLTIYGANSNWFNSYFGPLLKEAFDKINIF